MWDVTVVNTLAESSYLPISSSLWVVQWSIPRLENHWNIRLCHSLTLTSSNL